MKRDDSEKENEFSFKKNQNKQPKKKQKKLSSTQKKKRRKNHLLKSLQKQGLKRKKK